MEEKQEVELSFAEAMLSDIAADVAKMRRNTGFIALMLLLWLVVPFVFFLFSVVPAN